MKQTRKISILCRLHLVRWWAKNRKHLYWAWFECILASLEAEWILIACFGSNANGLTLIRAVLVESGHFCMEWTANEAHQTYSHWHHMGHITAYLTHKSPSWMEAISMAIQRSKNRERVCVCFSYSGGFVIIGDCIHAFQFSCRKSSFF